MQKVQKNILLSLMLCSLSAFLLLLKVDSINASTHISSSQKEIIRDTKRLNDIAVLREAIEKYHLRTGKYPTLEGSGDSNIKGYVVSVWPDKWSRFCSTLGLTECPVDPINEIYGCDCDIFGACVNDNINTNIDKSACYNSKTKTFACTQGSYLYQYRYFPAVNGGDEYYELSVEFEYSENINWGINFMGTNSRIITSNTCVGSEYNNYVKNVSDDTGTSEARCGDGILQYGEKCEAGQVMIEYCVDQATGKNGRKKVTCNDSCNWVSEGTCRLTGFCGDGEITSGEECDGGYEDMCFNYSKQKRSEGYENYDEYDSYHNWYSKQTRYCTASCKWNRQYIDNDSAYCGGYCGDGIIQREYDEECDPGANFAPRWSKSQNKFLFCEERTTSVNLNSDNTRDDRCEDDSNCTWNNGKCVNKHQKTTEQEKHCSPVTCKYENTEPVINFDFYKNTQSKNSYIKSKVWAGNDYDANSGEIIADKQGNNKYVAIWHSEYVEIKVNAQDANGDNLRYRYSITNALNNNIELRYFDTKTSSWKKYNGDSIDQDIIRIYPTNNVGGSNLENKNKTKLFGSNYSGEYGISVFVSDEYSLGEESETNVHNATANYTINFYIGAGCGDGEVSIELGETCEWKPNNVGKYANIEDIYTNWSVNEPSGNGDCVLLKMGSGWNGKWDDDGCTSNQKYICERRAGFGCDGWEKGDDDNCYLVLTNKNSYSNAKAFCESESGTLVVINDASEKNKINEILAKKGFGDGDYFWIGYQKTSGKYVSAEGNAWTNSGTYGFYEGDIYLAGKGTNRTNQYSCGLPGEKNACKQDLGYCGDGVYDSLFEECDRSDKESYGQGTDVNNQYYCGTGDGVNDRNPNDLLCRDEGGYCGDNEVQGQYEHCDPTVRITASQSADKTYGVSNKFHQYVCYSKNTTSSSGIYVYSDYEDFEENLDANSELMCRKSTGGYCGDGDIQLFYSKNNGNFVINNSDVINKNQVTNNSGIFYDVDAKVYKYNGTTLNSDQLKLIIEECDPGSYVCDPAVGGCVAPKDSSATNVYGGCAKVNTEVVSSSVVLTCYAYYESDGKTLVSNNPCVGSCSKVGNTCKKEDENSCYITYKKASNGKFTLMNYSGNCGCKRLNGGYCGDGTTQDQFGEECDPNQTDTNGTNIYQGGKLTKYDKSSIAQQSDVNRQYLCGTTTSYSNVSGSFLVKRDSKGDVVSGLSYANTNNNEMACDILGGYCGDGVIEVNYTTIKNQSDQSYFKTTQSSSDLEQCDPKGHYVDAKNSSSINTYACGSVKTEDACRDLAYNKKDNDGNYGGYCGDGYVQYAFKTVGVTNNSSNTSTFKSTTGGDPEQCDPNGHNVIPKGSNANNQYSCGTSGNDACRDLAGYCGDGVLYTYANWSANEPNGSGNCSTLNIGAGWSGKWDDVPCDWDYKYICEKENAADGNCPSGYVKNTQNHNCYKISSSAVAFSNATCSGEGEHLVIINNKEENEYINNLLTEKGISSVWLGYNSIAVSGNFVWKDGAGYIEECDPNSSDYKSGNTSRILTGGAVVSTPNKQYLCGSVNAWSSNKPSDVKKYNENGEVVSSFSFDASASGNNSCVTFGGYCGDGVIQHSISVTKNQSDQAWFYSNVNGTLEQCDPRGYNVAAKYSSNTNQYQCGDNLSENACKDFGGYCGDGTIQSAYGEECDPAEKDGNNYSNGILIANESTSVTRNSSATKQYRCGVTSALSQDNIPTDDKSRGVYTASGTISSTYTSAELGTVNNNAACKTFGGYCGDGYVQVSTDITKTQTEAEQFGLTTQGILEQCDPKNHSVSARYSSAYNTYACGSVNTTNACLDLKYNQKDANNKYGGYCGDGYVQYDLVSQGLDNKNTSNYSIFQTKSSSGQGNTPEQCDPLNHTVAAEFSSESNTYLCGATGTEQACKDQLYAINHKSGYCGDGKIQYNLSKDAVSQGDSAEKAAIVVSKNTPEQCDPAGHNVAPKDSSENNTYYCGTVAETEYACKDVLYATTNSITKKGGYCGDGFLQNGENGTQNKEQCDYASYVIPTPQQSSESKTYICGNKTTVYKGDTDHSLACKFVDASHGGGYCGDGVVQYCMNINGEVVENNNTCWTSANVAVTSSSIKTSLEQCDPKNHNVTPAESSSINRYICGTPTTADACKDLGGYCGDGVINMVVNKDSNNVYRISTTDYSKASDNYLVNGGATLEQCDPSYTPAIVETNKILASNKKLPEIHAHSTGNNSPDKGTDRQVTVDGASKGTLARGWNIFVFNSDWTFNAYTKYDTYGDAANATSLKTYLEGLSNDKYVLFVTYDEPNKNLGTIKSTLINFGANSGTLNKFTGHVSYIMVGKKGLGDGKNYFERFGKDGETGITFDTKDLKNNFLAVSGVILADAIHYTCKSDCSFNSTTSDFCGDGTVQTAKGEQCDPKNYTTPTPAQSSAINTYACSLSCGHTGGYCGDGIVDTSHGEECDPYGYDFPTASKSSSSHTYNCGSVGTEKACKKLYYDVKDTVTNKYGGYCGDGYVQYNLTKAAGKQNETVWQTNSNVNLDRPEQCDPMNYIKPLPLQTTAVYQYSCGAAGASNACMATGGYCGDGVIQDEDEACDFGSYVRPAPSASSSTKTYKCGQPSNGTYACQMLLNAQGGGYCGDNVLQEGFEEICEKTSNNSNFVGWFKFEDNLNDSSLKLKNGTTKEGTVTYGEGKYGKAAVFNGSTAVTATPDITATVDEKNTVAFWMKWNGDNNKMPLSFSSGYNVWIAGGYIGMNTSAGDLFGASGFTSDVYGNKWTHIAIVFTNGTPTTSNTTVYINGVKKTTLNRDNKTPNAKNASDTVYIGGRDTYKFIGSLDDVRFYRTGLTDAQIASIYNTGAQGNEYYDIYNSNAKLSNVSNMICTSSCGTTGDGWTCNSDYYWNATSKACVPVPANSIRIGTLHGGNDYRCDASFEKDGNGGCRPCEIGYYSLAGDTCKPCKTISNAIFTTNGKTYEGCAFVCKASYKYNGTARTCTSCDIGTWTADRNTSTTCSDCTAITNRYSWKTNGTAANNCDFTCSERTYKSGRECKTCAAGTYTANGNEKSSCDACTAIANSYWSTNGTTASNCGFTCKAGYKYNATNRTCTACGNGTYTTDKNTATSCSACTEISGREEWTSRGTSATTCTFNCKAGYKYNGTARTCTACTAGTYTAAKNTSTECSTCLAGYYCESGKSMQKCPTAYPNSPTGTTAITGCYMVTSAGKYIKAAKDTTETTCPAGSYCPGNINVYYGSYDVDGGRRACPVYYTQSADGSTADTNCYLTTTAGKYVKTAYANEEGCVANNFCDGGVKVYYGESNKGIGSCPSAYANADANATSINSCYLTTTAGKYIKAAKDTTQTACPANSYCPATKVYYGKYDTNGGRVACPTGYTKSAASSKAATDCYRTTAAGKYVKTAKDTSDTGCPAGSYCVGGVKVNYGSTGGSTACTSPYSNSDANSDDANDCYLTTTAGNYVKTAGAGQVACTAGSYCKGSTRIYVGGSVTDRYTTGGITACPANYTNSAASSKADTDCYLKTTAGYYVATAKAAQAKCPANSYCAGNVTIKYGSTGGSATCPSGYTKSAAGSTAASNCYLTTTAGQYIATANSSTQSKCTAGNYCPATTVYYGKSGTNGGGLTKCPDPYKNSAEGAKANTECYVKTTAGKYIATKGANSESSCPQKYYCPGNITIYYNSDKYGDTGGRKTCPSGYPDSAAGVSAATSCYLTTTAGKYIATANNSTQSACTAGNYCPSVKVYYGKSGTDGGLTACPSGYASSAASAKAISDCYLTTTAGKYIATANSSTQSACTTGNYCPATKVYYGKSGTNGGGLNACPTNYTNSAASSKTNTDCYLTTTAGKYVKTAQAAQVACDANGYCPGGVTVKYNSTGGRTACASPYTKSAASSDDANDCYLTTTAGKYVATAGAGEVACPTGKYCSGGTTIYKGGSVSGRNTTGGASNCPSGYASSDASSSGTAGCYLTTTAGKYIATANSATQSDCPAGYYCPATKVYYGKSGTNSGGLNTCPSGYSSSAKNSTAATSCYLTTTAGKYIASANTTTQSTCTAGYYCPATTVYYGKSSTNGGGLNKCNANYPNSGAGSIAASSCYLTTTAGYYVATAGAGQTTCAAGGYCTGGTTIYYGSTGGRSGCPSGYSNSGAGSTAASSCYLTTTAGYYVATAGARQTTCAAGGYCTGGTTIYYGSTGGRSGCPSTYPNAPASSTTINSCYVSVGAGEYVPTAGGGKKTCPANTYCSGTANVAYNGTRGVTGTCTAGSKWSNAGSSSCSDCAYSGWVSTTCDSSNQWYQIRSVASGNTNCNATAQTAGSCTYCSTVGYVGSVSCSGNGSSTAHKPTYCESNHNTDVANFCIIDTCQSTTNYRMYTIQNIYRSYGSSSNTGLCRDISPSYSNAFARESVGSQSFHGANYTTYACMYNMVYISGSYSWGALGSSGGSGSISHVYEGSSGNPYWENDLNTLNARINNGTCTLVDTKSCDESWSEQYASGRGTATIKKYKCKY